MPIFTPSALEPAWQSLLAGVAPRRIDDRALALLVQRLSRRYQGETVAITAGDARLARLLFWLPRDLPKLARPIAELVAAAALPWDRPLRVLDLGAGLGTSTVGIVRAFDGLRAAGWPGVPTVGAVEAVDVDPAALELLGLVVSDAAAQGRISNAPTVELRAADLVKSPAAMRAHGGPVDLIVFGASLVELTAGAGTEIERGDALADIVENAITYAPLVQGGSVVVIEPATRPEARALQQARRVLLERGRGVVAPCTHALACPMLARERDWCHEDLRVDLPDWLQAVAQLAGLRWQGLTFSYLVVQAQARDTVRTLVPAAEHTVSVGRLLSDPMASKGKVEAWVCTNGRAERWMQLDRTRRHAARANVDLRSLARGDVCARRSSDPSAEGASATVRLAPGDMTAARAPR